MRWLLNKLARWLAGKPRIVCDAGIWNAGVAELRKRTLKGKRESGAFLLGKPIDGSLRILEFAFYDDIDPHALDTGVVHFAGARLQVLWELCRKRGYGVVADVHVHPFGYGQSDSDQENPVMPRAGHIAMIIPDYASKGTEPGRIGLYEYCGDRVWREHTAAGKRFFRLEPA